MILVYTKNTINCYINLLLTTIQYYSSFNLKKKFFIQYLNKQVNNVATNIIFSFYRFLFRILEYILMTKKLEIEN